jgi:hypothetical protein
VRQKPEEVTTEKKLTVMERLVAKFAAIEAAKRAGVPEMQHRRTMLHRLIFILEIVRAHLNLEQRYSVCVGDKILLQKLGSEMGSGEN